MNEGNIELWIMTNRIFQCISENKGKCGRNDIILQSK